MSSFKLPGQFTYDGMEFHGDFKAESLDACRTFSFRKGDVLLASYPRTGTAWLMEAAYLLYNGVNTEAAKEKDQMLRVPFMELCMSSEKHRPILLEAPSPRLIKSHLPCRYFSKQISEGEIKTILIARNPKDALVSFYHFYKINKTLGNFTGTWDEWFELYKAKQLMYGDWFDYMREWWELKDSANVCIVKYEDVKETPHACVRQMAQFAQVELSSEQVDTIVEHCSFDSMKQNPSTNYEGNPRLDDTVGKYMRKGKVGDWKNFFSQAQSDYVDAEYQRFFGHTDLELLYML